MPHYKDGSPAQVGDIVFGAGYNVKHPIVGQVLHVQQNSETCNLQVVHIEEISIADLNKTQVVYEAQRAGTLLFNKTTENGETVPVFFRPGIEYGETRAFSLLARGSELVVAAEPVKV